MNPKPETRNPKRNKEADPARAEILAEWRQFAAPGENREPRRPGPIVAGIMARITTKGGRA
jgi:hypothetical protein